MIVSQKYMYKCSRNIGERKQSTWEVREASQRRNYLNLDLRDELDACQEGKQK